MKTIKLGGITFDGFALETELEVEETDYFDLEEYSNTRTDYSVNPTREVKEKTVMLKPGWKLNSVLNSDVPILQNDVMTLQQEIKTLLEVYVEDKKLQERHPALKDLYEKYQVTKALLKDRDNKEDPAP